MEEAGDICLFNPPLCLPDGAGKTAADHLEVLEKRKKSPQLLSFLFSLDFKHEAQQLFRCPQNNNHKVLC